MGLIGTTTSLWTALQDFRQSKPTWGTCAGMILLADKCVGASAVITNGQAFIGGMDVLVCRNYFGSQISSFEMDTPPPPPPPAAVVAVSDHDKDDDSPSSLPFPGVFIRAPAILSAGSEVQILSKVVATPCRQAALVLKELDEKLQKGENVLQQPSHDSATTTTTSDIIQLPGAAEGTNAREVICAVRNENLLCTAFHPELTSDLRWHEYFVAMVQEYRSKPRNTK
jgi:5'-phosphate synthase pdxT subunit